MSKEVLILLFAIVVLIVMIVAAIVSFIGIRRIKRMQKANKYIKHNWFLLCTNDGPDPCQNASDITFVQISKYDDSMLTDERASI